MMVLLALAAHLQNALPLGSSAGDAHARLPVMGYSNWYDTKCDVHAERFLEAADALEKLGLRSLGYTQINIDAGWALPQRDNTTQELVADPRFFPHGIANLSAELAARGFKLGGYTDRGTQQCGPSPGSKGHEERDAELFVRWNLSYVKSDDCYSTLDYAAAMDDYEKFAAALAAAAGKRDVYFLICGCKLGVGAPDPRKGWEQCPRDASHATGISAWRIASDDYTWGNVLVNANIYAGIAQFGGHGKFNDPDMLINQPMLGAGWPSPDICPNLQAWKGVRGRGFPPYSITRKQARLQMALWCTMGAPLILSMNIRELTDYDLETYSNAEAIAIDQDGLAQPGVRLQGYNLTTGVAPGPSPPHPSPGPPVPPAPPFNGTVIPNYNIVRQQCDACGQSATGCCIKGQPNLHVQYLSHKRAPSLNACAELCRSCTGCARSQSGIGTAGRCHSFVWNSKNYDCFGRLDSLFDEHNPFYSGSPGLFSGNFENESVATPTTAMAPGATSGNVSTTNVWGKKLSNGSFALLFINVGPKEVPSLTCGPDCVAKLLLGQHKTALEATTPASRYRVRDIWAKRDLPDQSAPLTIRSPPLEAGTGVFMVRLWPSD